MNELVFIHTLQKEPYTTSDIVSKYSGVSRRRIRNLITTYKNKFNELGVLTFETSKPIKNSKGGRPHNIYLLNEAHVTFLFGLLDNTNKVVQFNLELAKAFTSMKQQIENQKNELHQKDLMLERNHKTNKDLGETIKNCLPDNPHAFSNYHTLAYMVVTGLTPKQFREARNVTDAQDGLTANELERMELIRGTMAGLIELGKSYQEIKAIVQ